MRTFVVTLHVLSAVFLTGPLVFAALGGHRAVRRLDADGTRAAATTLFWFTLGSLLAAVLGFGAVSLSDRFTFRTPWIIISITLYVIMMGLATGYTTPALRKAARILDAGVPAGSDAKERLDPLAGRIAGSGGLVTLVLVAITILMVTKPFGD